MTGLQRLKPAPGARVRKADGSLLADAGEPIFITPYFARLIADGDIIAAMVPAKSKRTRKSA